VYLTKLKDMMDNGNPEVSVIAINTLTQVYLDFMGVKMETRCRLFTQTAPNCYVDLDVEIELNLVQYGVLIIEVNGKEVVGFRVSDLLIAVPVSFLS